jgi:hypothetical protein
LYITAPDIVAFEVVVDMQDALFGDIFIVNISGELFEELE